MAISFQKIEEKAPGLVNLSKLSRVELSKQELLGQKAKVVLCLDHSGSIRPYYKSGQMQRLAERTLAVATGLDDDGDIDFFVFDTKSDYMGSISLDNYEGAVDRMVAGRHMGTTAYDKAFEAIRDHFGFKVQQATPATAPTGSKGLFGFGKKKSSTPPEFVPVAPADVPVFVIFLTDGAPDSKPRAEKALKEVSAAPIFWKFFSIGREDSSQPSRPPPVEAKVQT